MKHPKANEQARSDFQAKIADYESKGRPIVYVDDSGFEQSMPRTHAYSPVGERCYGVHDWHAKGRINAIGAMMGFALVTVSLFEGSINADTFYAWLTQDLLPKLPEQAVIVMDNAAFHKRADILEAIRQTTCTLEFLPPYSPDLNPIERKWAQAKALRRQHYCDVDTLFYKYLDYASL